MRANRLRLILSKVRSLIKERTRIYKESPLLDAGARALKVQRLTQIEAELIALNKEGEKLCSK